MELYFYEGPVLMFGKVIAPNWKGQTRAVSEKKALANLTYQYKKTHNLAPSSKIELRGTLS